MSFLSDNPAWASFLGTAFQVGGELKAGFAASSAAKYRSKVASNNAVLARRYAQQAEERGKIAEAQRRIQTNQEVGKSRASAAARGVVVDQGSNAVQQQDIAVAGELDALTIRVNAMREKIAFQQQEQDFRAEASLEKASKTNFLQGALLSAGGTVANKWYEWNK